MTVKTAPAPAPANGTSRVYAGRYANETEIYDHAIRSDNPAMFPFGITWHVAHALRDWYTAMRDTKRTPPVAIRVRITAHYESENEK